MFWSGCRERESITRFEFAGGNRTCKLHCIAGGSAYGAFILHQRNTKYLQIQAAERAFDLVQSAGGNMRVYFGCFAVAVPEQALDVAAGSRRPVHQCVEPRNRRPQKRPLPVDNCIQGAK